MSRPGKKLASARDFKWLSCLLTVRGASPMLSRIKAGRAAAYFSPRGDRGESPPIIPPTLCMLSPC